MAVSKALSVDPLISGEYVSNKPSSSWSEERRDFAYADIISYLQAAVVKRRTVVVGDRRNSREH